MAMQISKLQINFLQINFFIYWDAHLGASGSSLLDRPENGENVDPIERRRRDKKGSTFLKTRLTARLSASVMQIGFLIRPRLIRDVHTSGKDTGADPPDLVCRSPLVISRPMYRRAMIVRKTSFGRGTAIPEQSRDHLQQQTRYALKNVTPCSAPSPFASLSAARRC